jgi:pantoate--beta-alanine ligase
MGALHEGHGALIDCARAACDIVVVTIFVNPVQFDRKEDYERYVINQEADLQFCSRRDVDIVFAPPVAEMYPEPVDSFVEVPDLSTHLCGAFRPGHFRGVATVVTKLFHIIQPDIAFFGEKDAQQLAIIQRMVRDLNFPVEIAPVPTVRESDGLALSSRNQRLSSGERRIAPVLFAALTAGQGAIAGGERCGTEIRRIVLGLLEAQPAIRVEYVEIVNARMQPVEQIVSDVRIAAAVWLGSTRLIDNVPVRFTPSS